MNDRVYLQLLKDYGLDVDVPAAPPISRDCTLRCCGPVEQNTGMWSCIKCGKVIQGNVISIDYEPIYEKQYRHQDNKALGGGEHWYTEKKRYYQPLTHFRQHMNSYLGKRNRLIPEWLKSTLLKTVDVHNKDAYIKVKQRLKDYGQAYYYKDIYSILYQLGGTLPHFIYPDDLEQEFKIWYNHFKAEGKFGGHNTPSMLMLLHLFLRRMNHTPFYDVPFLKSKKLRSRVVSIDKKILARRAGLGGTVAGELRWMASPLIRKPSA